MTLRRSFTASAVLVMLMAMPSEAAIRNVGAGQTHSTIAAALAASSAGDVINIVDSVHTEAGISIQVPVTIQGQGASATIVQAAESFGTASAGVFSAMVQGTVTLRDMTIQHGNKTGSGPRGGGIESLHATLILESVVVTFNRTAGDPGQAAFGGGISVSNGSLRMRDSVVSYNQAVGGDHGPSGYGGYATGGGISLGGGGSSEILDSLIVNNLAQGGDGSDDGYSFALGGGIQLTTASILVSGTAVCDNQASGGDVSSGHGGSAEGGGIHSSGGLLLFNSTVSGNIADAGAGTESTQAMGGGLYLNHDNSNQISYSTVADNQVNNADTIYGGGVYANAYSAGDGPVITSSVLADNLVNGSTAYADLHGAAVSGDYNIIENHSGAMSGATTHNLMGVDPQLDFLSDWGGGTWTHALLPSSVAIDRIPTGANDCQPGWYDQRGWFRASGASAGGSACDSGSYEAASADAGVLLVDPFETGDTWRWSATVP